MPKLIWEKKLQEAVKRQQRFGWSVREMKGAVFVQRYYPDINKRFCAALSLKLLVNQELNLLNTLHKIFEHFAFDTCIFKGYFESY